MRFGAAKERTEELRRHLARVALPPIIDMQGVVGVHLCVADADASGLETAERKGRTAGVPDWLIMIEASTPAAAETACDWLLATDLPKHGARPEVDCGLYALEVSRMKTRGAAG